MSRIAKNLDFPQLSSQGEGLLPLPGCQQSTGDSWVETEGDCCSQNSRAGEPVFVSFLGPDGHVLFIILDSKPASPLLWREIPPLPELFSIQTSLKRQFRTKVVRASAQKSVQN